MKLIKPYDDELMKYDSETHQYVLTSDVVLDRLGIDLSNYFQSNRDDTPSTQVDRFLKFISRHFYNYVYSHGNANNRNVVEYALAKDQDARIMVLNCMLNEVEYALTEGAFWNKSGVNISKGSAMDLSTLRDTRQISGDTESILWQPIKVLGVTPLYKGVIPVPFSMEWRHDY